MSQVPVQHIYLLFCAAEEPKKKELVSFFLQTFPDLQQPCLVEYSPKDNGPRNCAPAFAEGLSCEVQGKVELRKRQAAGRFPMPQTLEGSAPVQEEKEESREECQERLWAQLCAESGYVSRVMLLSHELADVLVDYLGSSDVLFADFVLSNGIELLKRVPPSSFGDYLAIKSSPSSVPGPKPNFQPSAASLKTSVPPSSTPKPNFQPGPAGPKVGPSPPGKPAVEIPRPPINAQPIGPPNSSPKPPPQVNPGFPSASKPEASNPLKFGPVPPSKTPTPTFAPTQAPAPLQKTGPFPPQFKPGQTPPFAQFKAGPTPKAGQPVEVSKAAPAVSERVVSESGPPFQQPASVLKTKEESKAVYVPSSGPTDPGGYRPKSNPIKAANLQTLDQFLPELTTSISTCIHEAFQSLSQRTAPSLDAVKDALIREVKTVLDDYHTLHVGEVRTFQRKVNDIFVQANEGNRQQMSHFEQTLGEVMSTQRTVTEEVNRLVSVTEAEGGVAARLKRNLELLEHINEESTEIYNSLPEITKSKRPYILFDSLDFNDRAQSLTIQFTNRKLYPIKGENLCFCLFDSEWKYHHFTEIAPGRQEITIRQLAPPAEVICCYCNNETIGESRLDRNFQGKLMFVGTLDRQILERNKEKADGIRQELGALSPELEGNLDRLMVTEEFDIWDVETIKAKLSGS